MSCLSVSNLTLWFLTVYKIHLFLEGRFYRSSPLQRLLSYTFFCFEYQQAPCSFVYPIDVIRQGADVDKPIQEIFIKLNKEPILLNTGNDTIQDVANPVFKEPEQL